MDAPIITLIILFIAIVLFVSERIPLAVTAMLVLISLVLTNILTPAEAFTGFINSNVILFCAMFVVGGALFETGMANKIGGVVTHFAKTERQLLLAIMLVTAVLSGFLSNTGTAAVLIPAVIGIASRSGIRRSKLLMPLAFASAMGGNLSLIGAPGNLIVNGTLENMTNGATSFGFFSFALIGLPLMAVALVYFLTIGYKLLPDRDGVGGAEIYDEPPVEAPRWKQYLALGILVATILAMVFDDVIGLDMHIVGVTGALVLVLTGVMTERRALDAIDSRVIFLFAGMLPMATAMQKTGLGSLMAETVMNFLGEAPSPRLLLSVLFLISAGLSQFMSNTATTALLAPIGGAIALGIGADPSAVLMAICIGGSCAYATPLGMPANTMVLGVGGYRFNDYAKAGLPLVVVGYLVCVILLPMIWPFFPEG
ncbi:SLC13/DASS family transporter [Halomonas aquamarina]|uniref:SLC13/DASS family transporter n=1 Tax=Vreelandella aquamarina TaxID=77097 RepID=A0ACC5VSD8_9GAMM|nr:SLC13 family permease [Halomonas aquamarina]MBZ5487160.1 SLC13/DASS family transporter [Halomonas aquamarina]